MMARYIDCDKCYHGRVCAYRHHYHDMIVECNHHIPTADVAEVKHGYWKEYYSATKFHYDCSCCDGGFTTEERCKTLPNYCSNCGAKMDGSEDE